MAFNITWNPFDEPNITAGMANMTSYINTTTSGYFGLGMLGVIWVVMYLVMHKRAGDMEGAAIATFVSTIFAGMFWFLGWITVVPFRVLIILTGLCFLVMWRRSK